MKHITCPLCGVGAESENDGLTIGPHLCRIAHDGDCTIYAADSGRAFDGVCTCGAGWRVVRLGVVPAEEALLAEWRRS